MVGTISRQGFHSRQRHRRGTSDGLWRWRISFRSVTSPGKPRRCSPDHLALASCTDRQQQQPSAHDASSKLYHTAEHFSYGSSGKAHMRPCSIVSFSNDGQGWGPASALRKKGFRRVGPRWWWRSRGPRPSCSYCLSSVADKPQQLSSLHGACRVSCTVRVSCLLCMTLQS